MAGANTNDLAEKSDGYDPDREPDAGRVVGNSSGVVVPHSAGGRASIVCALREQTSAAQALIEQMRDLVGDDDDMIATAIEGETDIHEAIAKAFARLAELKALMAGIDGMVLDLRARGDRFGKQSELIRDAIRLAMETAELRKIELPLGTISLKAVPPKAEIVDESAIPSRFWKTQEPKLDRKAVLDALKAKETVEGAMLSNGSQTIMVKFS